MSDNYKISNNERPYFLTMTTVGWIDVFIRSNHKKLIISSLEFCIKNKGLVVYAYCLMSNHLHMICQASDGNNLSDILRDFKTFTSKNIIKEIIKEPESRRDWMLEYFSKCCDHLKKKQKFKVWQDGNHAKIIESSSFLFQKLEYIHQNPVEELIVEYPEDYLFSSARNYAELDSYLDVCVLGHKSLVHSYK